MRPCSASDQPAVDACASPLGKSVSYRDTYAPGLLYPIARRAKREELGLGDPLPFVGEDCWNAYELSWLAAGGKPEVAIGTFRVPAASPCLIESKSLKLYLNSLNQTHFDDLDQVRETIASDLSRAAGARVEVALSLLRSRPERVFAYPEGVLLDTLEIDIDRYQLDPSLLCLRSGSEAVVRETVYSHLLKSNCLVTGQPDWGTLIVRYEGPAIDHESLLRYAVSYRMHDEFHEQCVERIFLDIMHRCRPDRLAVHARYTRRGGLDINPFRTTPGFAMADNLFEVRQ